VAWSVLYDEDCGFCRWGVERLLRLDRRHELEAVPVLLRLLPGGKGLARVAARFPRTVDRLYRFVARNRSTLGRLVGSRACAVDPSVRSSGARSYAGTKRKTGPESDST